ncbi:MAG: respiratory nitrate reductase subunit gamma [Methylotenera sp.]|nr:respiratory nitrate reductase subunit gamma [Methylotenera sp.]MDO9233883.1 respiratory nitrate reductase subunit gamma [Methylotenera sp.]MDO9389200.1 respiratory nitrate reductase subunit gamma [Methylotenera sp.]MDP1597237.1 respiratory nitrate reductase subunit gamma [Methylotenera sp.]MDP1754043.1 respiratory nitrate reductase subunit gamma [Methylotenera sp.]
MNLHNFLYGVYPYIALSVFLLGSLLRFDREQYTWKSDSSQLLSKANMRLGSNLFHVGIIAIFFGHAVGLLTPHSWFQSLGVSDMAHQMVAIWAGSIFGVMCLIGGVILWIRRMFNARVSAASRGSDKFILTWLLITLIIGLSTIPVSIGHANHGNPGVMIALAEWVQSIVYFRPNPALLDSVDTIFKVHLFFGMTVFLVFPFTRMVHVWSAPFGYVSRPYQVVRTKRKL